MVYQNYYEILGVDRKATPEQIKQAYRSKLSKWHPDLNAERQAEAEEKTKILNEAYYVLSDPNRRRQYDRILRYSWGRDFNREIHEEIFTRKFHRISPAMKRLKENAKNLYSMFRDGIKRKYKLHPATLGMIGGGLLYFLMPIDAVPDVIPIAGLLDDLAVLAAIHQAIAKDLSAYQLWKKSQVEPEV